MGLVRYATVLLLLGIALFARKYLPVPSRPTVEDGAAHLVARVELAADEAYDATKEYTADVGQLTAHWPAVLRDLGYFRRGALPLRSRLVVVSGSDGPTLSPPDGVRPGDVVIALSPDRRSYWITVFRLDRDGLVVPVTDGRGRAMVASAANGRAASRLDPLFPEYPNKMEHEAPF